MESGAYKESEGRELTVEFRTEGGKGVARKLRRNDRIPGVFYGSRTEPIPMSVNPEELVQALKTPKLINCLFDGFF